MSQEIGLSVVVCPPNPPFSHLLLDQSQTLRNTCRPSREPIRLDGHRRIHFSIPLDLGLTFAAFVFWDAVHDLRDMATAAPPGGAGTVGTGTAHAHVVRFA